MKIKMTINGKQIELNISSKERLLDILRENLGLIGTKESCGKGECGACTVLLDGRRVNSCLIPALQLEGSNVVTVEGLEKWKSFKSIERAYIENGAVQCGFCISGFVMSTAALLNECSPPVCLDEIKQALGGNLCRCTGYTKILQAVQELTNQKEIIQQIQEDWRDEFGSK